MSLRCSMHLQLGLPGISHSCVIDIDASKLPERLVDCLLTSRVKKNTVYLSVLD